MAEVAAPTIFVATLFLVLRRPKNLDIGLAALIGGAAALLAGVVTPRDVVSVAAMVWNATFALIGIIVISAILDQAGFFRWAALHLARRTGASGRWLFAGIVLMGAMVSTFFTNDSTVLILTPIVYEMLKALGFAPRQMIPFLVACGFVADAMSLPLPVSNLTNIIAADFFGLSFPRYVMLMALPSLLSLAGSLLVPLWLYRREIPARCSPDGLDHPSGAIRDPFLFRAGIAVLGAMAAVFFFGHTLRIPASAVIVGGAALLLTGTRVNRAVNPVRVLGRAPWHVVGFAMGMYLVVYGLGKVGLTAASAAVLQWSAGAGLAGATFGAGLWVAGLSAVMNNLPGLMSGALAIDAGGFQGITREAMVLAAVIGADIGPKLTPIGSLATLIWIHLLQERGILIGARDYLRIGLIITPPVLLAALAGLWAALALAG